MARRVLIADQNADAADSLATLLALYGYEVATAYTGPQVLAAVGSFRPDAAILNIDLPGLDGYEVARRVRAAPPAPLLIAVTGHGRPEDRRHALDAGFDHHLVKPADPGELRRLLGDPGPAIPS